MWAIHFGVYLHITAARVSLFNGHRFSGGRAGHIPTPLSQEHTQSTAFYEQAIAEFPSANLDNVLQSHNTVYYTVHLQKFPGCCPAWHIPWPCSVPLAKDIFCWSTSFWKASGILEPVHLDQIHSDYPSLVIIFGLIRNIALPTLLEAFGSDISKISPRKN